MGVFTMFGTRKENYLTFWVFLEVQEINFLSPLKVNINIADFYMNFYEKVPSTLDHAGFFSKYFLQRQRYSNKDFF